MEDKNELQPLDEELPESVSPVEPEIAPEVLEPEEPVMPEPDPIPETEPEQILPQAEIPEDDALVLPPVELEPEETIPAEDGAMPPLFPETGEPAPIPEEPAEEILPEPEAPDVPEVSDPALWALPPVTSPEEAETPAATEETYTISDPALWEAALLEPREPEEGRVSSNPALRGTALGRGAPSPTPAELEAHTISDPALWESGLTESAEPGDSPSAEPEAFAISDPALWEAGALEDAAPMEEFPAESEGYAISDPALWEVPPAEEDPMLAGDTIVVPEVTDPGYAGDPELDALLAGATPAIPLEETNPLESEEMSKTAANKKKKRNKKPIPRKGRPRRKKGEGLFGLPHLAASLIWLAIIVAIGVSLGKLLWAGAADVLAFGREEKMVTISILDSDNIDTIAAKLEEAGLVKYPELFKLYASLTGSDEEITTGTFELKTTLDYHALTNALSPSSSNRTVVTVTIPEGFSCRQIFNLLAANNVCSVELLEEYAATGELPEYWFLEGVERGDRYCLEGFLFPDTYEFYVNSTPKEAISKLLSGFNVRFSDELRDQIAVLNSRLAETMRGNGMDEEYIAEHQFTVYEVLIVASLIEEETAGTAESATIASVIYNRLYNWGDNPAYLNIDATIYYALDGNIDPATGNTMVLTSEDLQVDSPYNTYKYTGLTPGPISNPGLASLQAALDPAATSYYYYVLNPETGLHQFSKTLEEHEKWVEEFYPSGD